MPRELWKGAIQFGLVHIPVSLYPAEQREELSFTMAERLVEDMAMDWDPAQYHDTYRDDILRMIEEKASGKAKPEPKASRAPRGAEVIDFASLLEKSLGTRKKGNGSGARRAANDEDHGARKAPAARTRRKTTRAASHRKAA